MEEQIVDKVKDQEVIDLDTKKAEPEEVLGAAVEKVFKVPGTDVVVTERNEIVPIENSPNQLIAMAIHKDFDKEAFKMLIDMKQREDAKIAYSQYTVAMAAFKADPPVLIKDHQVSFKSRDGSSVTSYKHARLGSITKAISSKLSEHGLSASWKTKQNGKIIVTCRITHIGGHVEETELSADPDNSGKKNDIQATGSTITYLQRYTLLSITGLATMDQDDDGVGAENEYITEDQAMTLQSMIEEIPLSKSEQTRFMNVMQVDRLDHITDIKRATALHDDFKEKKANK